MLPRILIRHAFFLPSVETSKVPETISMPETVAASPCDALRRRPKLHHTPLTGWMNDPCAPWYDPRSKTYHLYFQYVPNTVYWTHDIGWGHACSVDLVHWEQDAEPVMMPSKIFDCMGVFTGTMYPQRGDEPLRVVYTAINDLVVPGSPDYVNGQERLATAVSTDRGKTWEKPANAHLGVMPPQKVAGWRDPYVGRWLELAQLLGVDGTTLFGIVCGSLAGQGPTVFLYQIDSTGLEWSYLGPMLQPLPSPPKPPSPWLGDHGYNFECTNAFEMGGSSFLVISPQGHYFERLDEEQPEAPKEGKKWQLWMRGGLRIGSAGPIFEIQEEGVLDWGCLYAAQTFTDDTGRRLVIDDDLHRHHKEVQNYSGSMSLVREVFGQITTGVRAALQTSLLDIPGFRLEQQDDLYTVSTLGIRPVQEMQHLRIKRCGAVSDMALNGCWEACLDARVERSSGRVGLSLEFATGRAEVIFESKLERISVRRLESTTDKTIATFTEHGKHTLFELTDGIEPLSLRVFFDGNILEVFANERFSLCTHLYGGPCSLSVIGEATAIAWQLD